MSVTPRTSIRDVAQAAGAAISTVSRALNDHPDVSAATRQRIQAIADELGYRQNVFARSLISGRSSLIGLIANEFNSFNGKYFAQLFQAIGGTARERHFELLVSFPCAAGEVREACTSLYRRGMANGALVVSPAMGEEAELWALQQAGFSIVVINPMTPQPGLSSIEPDNVTGACTATRHLLELGHQRIGLIAYLAAYSSGRDRIVGYEQALHTAGMVPDPQLITTEVPIREAVCRLLAVEPPPTALLCFNDDTAYAAISELAARGYDVPRDMSVLGFGDLPALPHVGVGLTTVHQPIEVIGKQAMEMLADLITGASEPGEHIRLATQLVVRGSTAPHAALSERIGCIGL